MVGQYTYCASSRGQRQSLQQKASSLSVAESSSILIVVGLSVFDMAYKFCKCFQLDEEIKVDASGNVLHPECCAKSTQLEFVTIDLSHDSETAAQLGKLFYRDAEKMEVDTFSETMEAILTKSRKRPCPNDSSFVNVL